MKGEHIISILESAPFNHLDESTLAQVHMHTQSCAECLQAFKAAQIASILLKEGEPETIEPSPFFQTRVLAALRERQAVNETPTLWRLWKATGALVSAMATTVAVLGVLTLTAPMDSKTSSESVSLPNTYSAEDLIFVQNVSTSDDMTNDQVFSTIYETDDDGSR